MSFDGSASTYDEDFTARPLAAWLRARAWSRLDALFVPGMRVLELGCGTGEDAAHLAARGVEVIATDVSQAMLATTRAKAEHLPLQTAYLDLNEPRTWADFGPLDGVYSNFGALNCTRAWGALAAWLGRQMPPGGAVALGVMGPFCAWESAWHGLHGDAATATRRWRGESLAVLADGARLPVYYPTPGRLRAAWRPLFRGRALLGLGVALPPSDIYPVIERRPRLARFLVQCEAALAPRFPWRAWGDHYWLELERVG